MPVSRMDKVKAMIKKTLPSKAQKDGFEGCVLYVEEHCSTVRQGCMRGMEIKFGLIKDTLKEINDKIDQIIGNENGKSERT